ncbi:hypothetical protein BT67DRAFT_492601 [Trichocladium antarcticum]|uniref:Uncharacterized protein n=1 Tax=Trichocladium antarcticum TaxID=1450529 RepID=A0AAN6Z9Q5_9PEZI|nr:hypothetical protein BT67DRAFT_492601 [Trichocladium antarcticum]
MSSKLDDPIPPRERPGFFRVLFEGGMLSRNDLFQLALTNKTYFKMMTLELYRENIKTTPFRNPASLICRAMDEDSDARLDRWLELGEFVYDTGSPNARVLYANKGQGIHLLMAACIKKGAEKCLRMLMAYTARPGVPFTYDRMWVYEGAKNVALGFGLVQCLMMLHDTDRDKYYPCPDAIYNTILRHAHSPRIINWMEARLPNDMASLVEALESQCGVRHTQPAVIEVLLDKVPLASRNPSGRVRPNHLRALCVAAGALHTTAVELIIETSTKLKAFDPNPKTIYTHSYNPLLAVLTQRLPTNPSTSPSACCTPVLPAAQLPADHDPHGARLAHEANLTTWHNSTKRTARLMYHLTKLLVPVARQQLRRHPDALDSLLARAALTYVFVLRSFLLANIPWLLPRRVTDRILVAANPSRKTRWNSEGEEWPLFIYSYGPEGADEPLRGGGETALDYTWRTELSGKWLRERLEQAGVRLDAALEGIWRLLLEGVQRQVAAVADMYLDVWAKIGRREWGSVDALWELLVAGERLVRKVKVVALVPAAAPEWVQMARPRTRRETREETAGGGDGSGKRPREDSGDGKSGKG